jgi:CO/xanthine dehydrogenase Mo-binding subunit
MAETTVKPWGETTIVGKPIPRVDGYERVSGGAVYPVDVILPNMLYGATLRCPHPHATVKKIAVGKAREMPGVRAVLTDADPDRMVLGFGTSRPRRQADAEPALRPALPV